MYKCSCMQRIPNWYPWWLKCQRAATRCSTLQHNTLQHTATPCYTIPYKPRPVTVIEPLINTLQHTAPRCNTLQRTATHRNTPQHTATHCNTQQHTTTHYNTLQHTATHHNTLQHTATHWTHCNTLQHTVPYNTRPAIMTEPRNLILFWNEGT